MTRNHLISASSLAAIAALLALPAAAQIVPPADQPEEPVDTAVSADIVVTGSRIVSTGYRQPTPVTVIGEEQLMRDAKPTIGDSIRELPAVGGSASANNATSNNNISGAITGIDTVNLRNFGPTRTLVLLDGQRVVASNITGIVDIGTIPSMLVERVDVVTGGASAAWGSDAVAGVVNLVLNKNFKGLRASAEYGDNNESDYKTYRLQAAAGTGFGDGRGRLLVAGNYLNSPDTVFANARKWNRYRNLITNPAYTPTNNEPRLIHADNTGLSQATNGGLIQGPACLVAVVAGVCASPNPLRNIQFIGANATPTPFNPGIVAGPNAAGGDTELFYPATNNLAVPYRTINLFAYSDYEITDTLRASIQLNYGSSFARNNTTPSVRFGTLSIQRDNAFLPESIRAQMTTLGLNAIQIGTTNINNIPFDEYSHKNFATNAVGIPVSEQRRRLLRGVASLDGKIGADWTWNAYYQHGESRTQVETLSNLISARYNFAVDAVRDPSNGAIVCRATLPGATFNAAAAGCVPLNVIGEGVASQAAIRYVNVSPGQNFEVIRVSQDVAAVSAQGKLPFGLPAGNISAAFGAEYRREKGRTETDAGSAARQYAFANFTAFSGQYNVKEAFLELDVPLLDDIFVKSLDLNAAGRITDYSTSGVVKTWKLGLTSEINDMIRLRGTYSQDIRAPNLNELFSTGVVSSSNSIDPRTGINVPVLSVVSGNRDLTPEKSKTLSAGVVLNPARRLNLSVDYYAISLNDAIVAAPTNTVLQSCNAGQLEFCSQLDFNGPNGALSQIRAFPRNLSSVKTSGVDFQLDHQTALLSGTLSSRLLGNYTINQSQVSLGVETKYDGALSIESPAQGFPKVRMTGNVTYGQGPVSGTVQARFIGQAKLINSWTAKDVDDNRVPAIAYIDLRGSAQAGDAQIFGAIDNLLNQDPPNIAVSQTISESTYSTAVRGNIYDLLGRTYRVGVRVKF